MGDTTNQFNRFEGFGGFNVNGTIADMPAKNAGKKILVLFIVDATKSMEGPAIGQVNHALTELFSDMKSYASDNVLNMELAIMSFSNSVKWEMQPEDINNCFSVPQINVRPGNTQYGVVYNELNKRLNKNDLLKSTGKQAPPVLVFLTDGAPVDDYKYDMEQLRKNGNFMLANRSAVIMGEGANDSDARNAVAEFTMDENMVLTTDSTEKIKDTIKLATLHTIKGTEINKKAEVPSPGNIPFPHGSQNDTPTETGNSTIPPQPSPDPEYNPFNLENENNTAAATGTIPNPFGNPFDPGAGNGTNTETGTALDSPSTQTGNPFGFEDTNNTTATDTTPELPLNPADSPFPFDQMSENNTASIPGLQPSLPGSDPAESPFKISQTECTDPDDLFADLEDQQSETERIINGK